MTIQQLSNIEYIKPVYNKKNYFVTSYGRIYLLLKNGKLKQTGKTKQSLGYYKCSISKKTYQSHQIIMYAFYNFPFRKSKLNIHHINEKKNNNHLKNLEITTSRRNSSASKNTKYPTGVTITPSNKYLSCIQNKRKTKNLGTYLTIKEASQKYIEAEAIADKHLLEEIKTYFLDFTNTIPISKFNSKIDYHNKIPFFKDEYNISTINLKYYFQLSKKLISSSFKIHKNYFKSTTQKTQNLKPFLKFPNGWLNHPTQYPSQIYTRW